MNKSKNILISSYYIIPKRGLLTIGAIIIIILSFEVLPFTGISLVLIRGTEDKSYNIFYGRTDYNENEHIMVPVPRLL